MDPDTDLVHLEWDGSLTLNLYQKKSWRNPTIDCCTANVLYRMWLYGRIGSQGWYSPGLGYGNPFGVGHPAPKGQRLIAWGSNPQDCYQSPYL